MSNIKENVENVNKNSCSRKSNNIVLRIIYALIIVALIILDQWTKIMAVDNLMNAEPIVIIDGIFELLYVENRGAAFGMLSGGVDFFVIITCILVPAMIFVIWKIDDIIKTYGDKVNYKAYSALKVDFVFLIAGALGNFIDRVVNGFVVDFFYFKLIDFPVFNVADIYVTLATIVLLIILFFTLKERELDYIIYPKKKWAVIDEKSYNDEANKSKTASINEQIETENLEDMDEKVEIVEETEE